MINNIDNLDIRAIIAIQSLQIPIITMLVLTGWQVWKRIKLEPFKYLFLSWLIDLLYMTFKLQSNIFRDHEMCEIKSLFTYFIVKSHLTINVDVFEKDVLTGIDFLLNLASTYLLLYSMKEAKLRGRNYFNFSGKAHLLLFCLIYVPIYLVYLAGYESVYGLLVAVLNITVLFLFYRFMLHYKEVKLHVTFFMGVGLYTAIQFLSIILIFFPSQLTSVEFIGYLSGAVAKCLMVYGLIEIFVNKALESSENKAVANKLNLILGRTFHEILPPVIDLENIIFKLYPNDEAARDSDFMLNKKALREMERMDHALMRLRTILSASHKMYISDAHLINLDSALLDLEVTGGVKEAVNNINVLIEIAIMNFKGEMDRIKLNNDRLYFLTEYGAKCNVFCNSVEMVQIFFNLFKNSCEALNGKKGQVFVKTRNIVDKETLKKMIQVIIEDDGPGIPQVYQEEIFTVGFSTKQDEGRGRGYGMDIIKTYTEKNGGTVQLESPISDPHIIDNGNPGTKFVFLFNKAIL